MKKAILVVLTLAMCLAISPSAKAERTVNMIYNEYDWLPCYLHGGKVFADNASQDGTYWVTVLANNSYTTTPTTMKFNINGGMVRGNHEDESTDKKYQLINFCDIKITINGKTVAQMGNVLNEDAMPYYEFTPILASGLTPNTRYSIGFTSKITYNETNSRGVILNTITKIYTDFMFDYYYSSTGELRGTDCYTEAATPIISFSNIRDKQITINWNSNGNPYGTSYDVQRRIGEAPWVTIVSGTVANAFTDTNLVEETIYTYRVKVKHVAEYNWDGAYGDGAVWDVYTPEYKVTTTANPAVAAAQEAASAAQAAKIAAENAVQNTVDAKNAAISAETKAQEVYDLVNNLDLGSMKTDITNIKAMIGASIDKVYTTNGATAVKGTSNSPPIAVESTGITHFQLSLAGINWSIPIGENCSASISGLADGYNTIRVRGYNANIPESERVYINKQIGIFKIK